MTLAIIQARMGSTRLSGKILKPILGKSMLAHMLERVQRARSVDAIMIATTDKPEDDPTAELARAYRTRVFRGSESDVLDRFYRAAESMHPDVVVRLTGDCPLSDPSSIDAVVHRFFEQRCDYTSTPHNYPEGLDAEVFSFTALKHAAEHARLPSEREHVTPYIKNHPELFRLDTPWASGSDDHSAMHWSVDSAADFNFVNSVFEKLYPQNPFFTKDDVLNLLAREPDLLAINKGGTGYEGLAKSLEEDKKFNQKI